MFHADFTLKTPTLYHEIPHVFCENRKADVYISLDKIALVQKLEDGCLIELEGGRTEAVKVLLTAEDLVRKINGEDKETIGFRTSR